MAPRLTTMCGRSRSLDVDRWTGRTAADEARLMDLALGPVLDIGCGPGRHVAELSERGVVALGIDVSPAAVELALSRGAPALRRSIFERVPGEGRWRTALLIDGNIGIGGDPGSLLARCKEVLRPRGCLLIEFDPPGWPTGQVEARIEAGEGTSAWFPWAHVSIDDAPAVAGRAGFRVVDGWDGNGRWFACLESET